MNEDDFIQLIDEPEGRAPVVSAKPWKVAIIDDDPSVHDGTRLALSDYVLHGHGLELLSAYSAAEGRQLLAAHPDIAVVLLDVIMETDDAGLGLIDYVRTTLNRESLRIILRTGQPGQAPERRVIVDYDINDYKAKNELTADRLFTSLTAALRSYQQLQRMVETRRGLEIIIDAASTMFDLKSMQRLAEGVLTQMASLLNADCAGILVLRENGARTPSFSVLAGSGCYRDIGGDSQSAPLKDDLRRLVEEAFQRRRHDFTGDRSILYIQTGSGREIVVLLEAARELSATDRALVEIFTSRLSVAFDNVILYQQLQEANAQLEQRVADRTRELTSANSRLASRWTELQKVNAFKSDILSTVAHDLRNPLGVILGRAEMLRSMLNSGPETENLVAQIDHISKAARNLSEMVSDLLSDAMADAMDIKIRKETVNIAALAAEQCATNQPLAAKKNQTLIFAAPEQLNASCDADRLREAIDNLVSNAIKYSPRDSTIQVSVTQQAEDVVISVADEGPGLSPEDMARLFGRFQRLSAKPTGGESSTGLGLSIVKRIVNLHGGSVAAESSSPGAGTTFAIRLPAT
jgi:signal transduction histidine kinase/response regulator of citrate/malate metabolism